MNSNLTFNAFFIGFLIGIVLYSILMNSWGWFTLIPLYLAYRLIRSSNPGEGPNNPGEGPEPESGERKKE